MAAAEVYAQLSSAIRLKVGCVIVKDNTIIGIGYNGMPSGWDNNCEYEIIVEEDEKFIKGLKTKPEVLHAETNALAKIAKSTNSSDGASMFITPEVMGAHVGPEHSHTTGRHHDLAFRAATAEFLLQLMRPQAFRFAWHQSISGIILR